MIQRLTHATIYVLDQDAARDFYINKLGFEVRMDQSMDNGFRWLTVVAPAVEQSGVGHTITYLHPLVVHKEHRQGTFFGWKVEGSPADCAKLGILELSPQKPDLVISGINTGSNVGINVIYSGTVAGAVEGAFFGIPSIAVSQWTDPPAVAPVESNNTQLPCTAGGGASRPCSCE